MAITILIPLFMIHPRKLILNYHGEDLLYSGRIGTILGKATEKFAKLYADVIIVPSNFFKNILHKKAICDDEKIIVFPSGGVDPQIFYPSHKVLDSNCLKLGFVGRIEQGKGWKEYILALNSLKDRIKFRGYIIGYGTLEDDMQTLISQCGLKEHIEHIKGIPQKELQYYYSLFDLLLFTTQLPESLGLVGLEAMACGTPIVATNIGGVATYTIDKKNGFLVNKGDIEGIVSCIIQYKCMSNEDKELMISNCINTANQYSTKRIYISFINDLRKHLNC